MTRPVRLRVEHLGDGVLGVGARMPRLSWWLPEGTSRQEAYEIQLDGRPGVRVVSARNLLVPWPSSPVASRQRVVWRVRVWTDLGESEWSEPAWFETGLLDPVDWVAHWIEPHEPELGPSGRRPAHRLRHTFDLPAVPAEARLHATAHGIYETFLNGQRVGDLELTPGFTSYWTELHVQTYDVGNLLVTGTNIWEVELTDGWFRGRCGNGQTTENYGDRLAFLAQLHADDATVTTDGTWTSGRSLIVAADLMAGQAEDHRIEPGDWHPVTVADHDLDRLAASPAPPTRRTQELRPLAVRRLDEATQVVDLGQNINGWLRLADLGPPDTEVTLVHGEALDASGDVTLEHLGLVGDALGQTDQVVSAGRAGDAFEPRHTTHGFQYVRIEGHPHRLSPADVTGVVVHTDLRRVGWFRCSDERINRLHQIADWSFRDNACEVPTDCPQRERSGWTGDWRVFLPSAAFLYDVAGFSRRWLRDLAADQLPDGCVANMAPDPRRPRDMADVDIRWLGMLGSSGWGDAVVEVPWDLYRIYGDEEVLRELWPSMLRWVDYAATSARTKRHPTRAGRRPTPAPHEAYLWDGGWHWGEWHEPGGLGDFWSADQGHVGTAFLHRSAAMVADVARVLGFEADAERHDELAALALEAWQLEYVAADGSITPDTQAGHVRALAYELVPGERREQTVERLVELVREAGNHVGTGFLATPDLLPVLADAGHLDVAYDLLLQDTPPSWLAMVERGATTVWEGWEGIGEDGSAHDSLNHYSKGAVISFLHSYVAGIQLVEGQPAYRRFRVAPAPGGGITWAEAAHDSPHGRIESSWRVDGDRFRLVVTVPPGTTAEVLLPDGQMLEQLPGTGTHDCSWAAGR